MYLGAGRAELREMDSPARPEGGLLVRMVACGICGSDLMSWYQDRRAPMVLGHEPVGEVISGTVGEIGPGDRVVVHHHVPCLACDHCRNGRETLCPRFRQTRIEPGGLAEVIAVPAENAALDTLRIPDHLDWDAGVLVEPLACVVRGLARAGAGPGRRLLVVGAGATGLLEIDAARAAGCTVAVAEPRADRRERAAADGTPVVAQAEPEAVADALGGAPQIVIVCTGAPAAIVEALACAAPGGVVQLFAPTDPEAPVTLDLSDTWFREVRLEATYSAGPADTRRALALLAAGRVDVGRVVSHHLPLRRGGEALDLARSPEVTKVVVVGDSRYQGTGLC